MKTSAKCASAELPNPQAGDYEVNAHLAGMRELYALLLACERNSGKRTTHRFAVDAAELARVATGEGFASEINGNVLTVSRR